MDWGVNGQEHCSFASVFSLYFLDAINGELCEIEALPLLKKKKKAVKRFYYQDIYPI